MCELVVKMLMDVLIQFTEESSVVSSSEDRSRVARTSSMSDVAVQTIKEVSMLF